MLVDLTSFWIMFVLACVAGYLCISSIDTNNVLFGMFSIILYTICGFSALGLQTMNDGVSTVYSYPAVSILCFGCCIIVLIGTIEEAYGFSIVEKYGAWK